MLVTFTGTQLSLALSPKGPDLPGGAMLPWCTQLRLAAGPSSVSATWPLWPLRGSVSLQMAHLHLSAVSYHLPSCRSSVPSLPELVAWQGAVTSSPHALLSLGGGDAVKVLSSAGLVQGD